MTFDSDSDATDDDFRMKNTPKQKPIHEVRLGFIKAAVWRNETEAGIRYNTTFERIYKDKDDEPWKSTASFGRDDLLILSKVADQVHTFIFNEMQEKEEGAPKTRP